jgi:hypothetical protein
MLLRLPRVFTNAMTDIDLMHLFHMVPREKRDYRFIPYTTKNIGKNYVKRGRKTYQPNGEREQLRRKIQREKRAFKTALACHNEKLFSEIRV